VDVVASLVTEAAPDAVYAVVSDLGTYPQWLEIVAAARPVEGEPDEWFVDLRAQLGPLRRTKRLRMRRTVADAPEHVRFERHETDGRSHSAWVMDATLAQVDETSVQLTVSLSYSGSLWIPVLDRILADEITRSRGRLADVVAARGA
jgi:ribosome-associated toxin RatA of RatAB toxin-antitoxin module